MLGIKKTGSPFNFIVLDVGTEIVKALVCEMVNDNVIVKGVGKARQNPGDMQHGSVLDIARVIKHQSI